MSCIIELRADFDGDGRKDKFVGSRAELETLHSQTTIRLEGVADQIAFTKEQLDIYKDGLLLGSINAAAQIASDISLLYLSIVAEGNIKGIAAAGHLLAEIASATQDLIETVQGVLNRPGEVYDNLDNVANLTIQTYSKVLAETKFFQKVLPGISDVWSLVKDVNEAIDGFQSIRSGILKAQEDLKSLEVKERSLESAVHEIGEALANHDEEAVSAFIHIDPTQSSLTFDLADYGFAEGMNVQVTLEGYVSVAIDHEEDIYNQEIWRIHSAQYSGADVLGGGEFSLTQGTILSVTNHDTPIDDNRDLNGDYGIRVEEICPDHLMFA